MKLEGTIIGSYDEAKLSYVNDKIELHAKVKFRLNGELIDTTLGRIIFNSVLLKDLNIKTELLGKSNS